MKSIYDVQCNLYDEQFCLTPFYQSFYGCLETYKIVCTSLGQLIGARSLTLGNVSIWVQLLTLWTGLVLQDQIYENCCSCVHTLTFSLTYLRSEWRKCTNDNNKNLTAIHSTWNTNFYVKIGLKSSIVKVWIKMQNVVKFFC